MARPLKEPEFALLADVQKCVAVKAAVKAAVKRITGADLAGGWHDHPLGLAAAATKKGTAVPPAWHGPCKSSDRGGRDRAKRPPLGNRLMRGRGLVNPCEHLANPQIGD